MASRLLTNLLLSMIIGLSMSAVAKADTSEMRKSVLRGINWFDGSVEEAFALAKAEDKPLFLYWGAVWCPPCQETKANVFTRHDFIDQTRNFVSVYLDGDTERAQKWGEELNAAGYPTLLVLLPDRSEVLRLSSGDHPSIYAEALASAQESLQPFSEITKKALDVEKSKTLTRNEYEQIAYRSWNEEDAPNDKGLYVQLSEIYLILSARGDNNFDDLIQRLIWESWLWLDYEKTLSQAAEKNRKSAIDALVQQIAILTDEEPVGLKAENIHLTSLTYAPVSLLKTFKAANTEQSQLEDVAKSFNRAIDFLLDEESLSSIDQLQLMTTKIGISKQLGKDPSEIVTKSREMFDQFLQKSETAYERTALVNAAVNSYFANAQYAQAYEILQQQARRSDTPYYQIQGMASMAKRMGNEEEAIRLYEKAYTDSKGPATRAQWGTNYLLAVIEIAPDNGERISAIFDHMLSELETQVDPVSGRTKARMTKIHKALAKWAEKGKESAAVAKTMGERYSQFCTKIYEEQGAKDKCLSLAGTD